MAANASPELSAVEWEREQATLVALLSNSSLSSDTVAALHALLHAHQAYYKALVNPKVHFCAPSRLFECSLLLALALPPS